MISSSVPARKASSAIPYVAAAHWAGREMAPQTSAETPDRARKAHFSMTDPGGRATSLPGSALSRSIMRTWWATSKTGAMRSFQTGKAAFMGGRAPWALTGSNANQGPGKMQEGL